MDLAKEIASLPLPLQKELKEFLSFLKFKASQQNIADLENKEENQIWQLGMWKGKIKMTDDFDEPLSDFNDYM